MRMRWAAAGPNRQSSATIMQTRPAEEGITQVALKPSAVACVLGAVAVVLVIADIAGQLSRYVSGHDRVLGLVRLFDLDVEGNIPTLFSVFLLFFAALLLVVITSFKKMQADRDVSRWAVLTIGFFFMAIDEGASIHEMLILPVRGLLGQGAPGVFYWAWVVPGIAVVLVLALYFFGFILRLPPRMRYTCLLAGFLYVGGAVGLELIGGYYAKLHGTRNLSYNMLVVVEESLEMAGSVLFIYALLRYLADNGRGVRIWFR